jgi:hypothetical protein
VLPAPVVVPSADEVAERVAAVLPAPVVVPSADEVAERVAADLEPILAQLAQVRRSDLSGAAMVEAAARAAAAQFELQMEAFNDRVRSASRSLEALADELASRDRTAAAFTDQLGRTVQGSVERLIRRLDESQQP